MVGYDGTTDFDDRELLARDGGEVIEVLVDLFLRANRAEELDDGGSSGSDWVD